MTKKTKKRTYITPIGTAVFPSLDKPEQYVDKNNPNKIGLPRYSIKLALAPADLAKAQEAIAEMATGMEVGKNLNSPFKQDKKDPERVLLAAHSGAKYKPPLFDAAMQKLPPDFVVYGGSKVRLDVTPAGYDGFGGGVTLYLNAVQVIEPAAPYTPSFSATDGYKHEASDAAEQGPEEQADDMDDEIPF